MTYRLDLPEEGEGAHLLASLDTLQKAAEITGGDFLALLDDLDDARPATVSHVMAALFVSLQGTPPSFSLPITDLARRCSDALCRHYAGLDREAFRERQIADALAKYRKAAEIELLKAKIVREMLEAHDVKLPSPA